MSGRKGTRLSSRSAKRRLQQNGGGNRGIHERFPDRSPSMTSHALPNERFRAIYRLSRIRDHKSAVCSPMIHGRSRVRSTWRYIAVDETLKPSRRSHVNLPSTACSIPLCGMYRGIAIFPNHVHPQSVPPSTASRCLLDDRRAGVLSSARSFARTITARVAGIVSRAS
jgi:hypothetical protein